MKIRACLAAGHYRPEHKKTDSPLLLGDDCIKDYPLLNRTKRHPFEMRTSSCKGFFDWQFRPNQSDA